MVLLSSALGGGCGAGGTPEPASPDDTEGDASAFDDGGDAEGSERAAASDDEETAEAAPAPVCDDGSCSPCGNGLCPVGWYCDEDAGPACSWVPECARRTSCDCLRRVLGAECTCNEHGPVPVVSCK
ncbi:MAG: hypothetical protein DIU78_020930 [Pseudomonadota bacterium]|nr:MAG: hypothetical protein DIU78_17665 [Pseudomonadota bacterium]